MAKKPPASPRLTIEARFKERITATFQASLSAAMEYVALSLGLVDPGGTAAGVKVPARRSRYEFELAGGGWWRAECELDVNTTRDTVGLCAFHKLQALTALCETKQAAAKYGAGITALVRQLAGRADTVIPGFGIKRVVLPGKAELWMSETLPGSGHFNVSVVTHVAATVAAVRCGHALGDPELFADASQLAQVWFEALRKLYTKDKWTDRPMLDNAIMWEGLVLMSTAIRPGSSFREDVEELAHDFGSFYEAYLRHAPKAWSFNAANAAALSWAREKKEKPRKRLGRLVDELAKRWREYVAPNLDVGAAHTCGAMQGYVQLLKKQNVDDIASLAGSVLEVIQKDIDLFQVRSADTALPPSRAVKRLPRGVLQSQGGALEGAFLRDERYLAAEERWSIRIDDTFHCVNALSRALLFVEDLASVDAGAASLREFKKTGGSNFGSDGEL